MYNGHVQTIEGVQETESTEYEGYVEVGTYTNGSTTYVAYANINGIKAEGKDAGHYSTPLLAPLYRPSSRSGMRPIENAYIPVANNILDIEPVEMTVKTGSAVKAPDEAALTAGGSVALGEKKAEFSNEETEISLIEGDSMLIKATGSQTEAGESKNTYTINWAEGTNSHNYKIIEELGTLHVHGLRHVAKAAATYTKAGNIEYWVCDQGENCCEKYFKDAKCTSETAKNATMIPMLAKKANTLKVKGKTVKIKKATKNGKLKKTKTLKVGKVVKFVNKGQGKKTYSITSAKKGEKSFKKYIKINKKTGKVTLKKGLKKGTYKVKVKVKAAGNASHKAMTRTVTFKVKIRK